MQFSIIYCFICNVRPQIKQAHELLSARGKSATSPSFASHATKLEAVFHALRKVRTPCIERTTRRGQSAYAHITHYMIRTLCV